MAVADASGEDGAAGSSAGRAAAFDADHIAPVSAAGAAAEFTAVEHDSESDSVWQIGGLNGEEEQGVSGPDTAANASSLTTAPAIVDRRSVVWHCLPYVGVMERLPRAGPWGERTLFLRSCGLDE